MQFRYLEGFLHDPSTTFTLCFSSGKISAECQVVTWGQQRGVENCPESFAAGSITSRAAHKSSDQHKSPRLPVQFVMSGAFLKDSPMDLIRDNLEALRQQTTKSVVRVLETAYPLPNTQPSDRYTTPDPISSQLSQGTITDALTHRPPNSRLSLSCTYLPVFHVAAGGLSVRHDSTESQSRPRDGAEPRVGVTMGRHGSTRYSVPVPSTVETLLTADAPTHLGNPAAFCS